MSKKDCAFRSDVIFPLICIFILSLIAFTVVLCFNIKNQQRVMELQELIIGLDETIVDGR
ncbi:MAG: hypothetical protein ABH846_01855 [Patescibacteria group bacterium]